MSDESPFNQPPSGTPVSPISQPSGRPWKPFAAGVAAAGVIGAGVFGAIALTGDDDPEALTGDSIPGVVDPVDATVGPEFSAPDVTLPDVSLPEITVPDVSVPTVTVPGSTPSGTLPQSPNLELPDLGSLPELSIPGLNPEMFEQMSECFAGLDLSELGLDDMLGDLGELGTLGSLPISIPDLSELGELGDLGETGDLGELQTMLEELLGELSGSIPELGAVSIPEFTMPGGSLPQFSLPFDPAELEACFGDLQLGE